jgi:hypothetical protein
MERPLARITRYGGPAASEIRKRLPRSFDHVFGHLVGVIECDLLIGTVEPIVLCKQYQAIRLLASPNGADQRLSWPILANFPLGVPSSLISTMLVFEKFPIYPDRFEDSLLDGSRHGRQPQSVLQVQIAQPLLNSTNNLVSFSESVVSAALFEPTAI